MMNDVFADMIAEGWLEIYMDDMLLHSETEEQDSSRTERVLQRLMENDLYLKPQKCAFDAEEVEYLGMVITPGKIAMDPAKLVGIAEWPAPLNTKQVRSFLGFANFYRRFIDRYLDLARPLNELTQKERKFEWKDSQEQAFLAMKEAFLRAPVLIMPDPMKPFTVEADASKWAMGAVLKQRDTNGDWHPCGFISKTFDLTQRNYDVGDRELLGIITALEMWRRISKSTAEITPRTGNLYSRSWSSRTITELMRQQNRPLSS
jgi:hypothetical protein